MVGQFVPAYSNGNAQFVPMDYVIFDLIGNQRFTNHNSKYGAKRMIGIKLRRG